MNIFAKVIISTKPPEAGQVEPTSFHFKISNSQISLSQEKFSINSRSIVDPNILLMLVQVPVK